jgi:2-dehydropantoate 2-reductase
MGEPHWHVLGAGAIGCLFADALHSSGGKSTLIMRAGTRQKSISIVVEQGGARREQQLDVVTPEHREVISHLLVTTKAYDVRDAVASVAHLVTEDGVVLLLANGMGFTELVREDWPHLNIYCGTTTQGAYRVDKQHIRHAGRGETRIGRTGQKEPPPWFGHWARAINPSLWDRNIETALWSKLAVNCIINPLTAVHGCLNGELDGRSDLAAQVATLCDEVAHISRAEGFADIAAALPHTVAGVIAGTAANRSSMLQDVQGGCRTEIDYITGYLLQVADRHGIDAPHNRALLESIKNRGN